MPPIKLKLNLAAVAGVGLSTPVARSSGSKQSGRSVRETSEDDYRPEGTLTSPFADDALGLRMGEEDDDEDYHQPHTTTDPKPIIKLNLSSLPIYSESPSAMSSATSTPMNGTPVSTPGPSDPKRKRGRPKKRPTAIPAHLVTPRSTPWSPPTGLSTPMSEMEMQADDYDIDPLSLPMSPNGEAALPFEYGGESPQNDGSYNTPRQARWKRVKRPFDELARGVLAQMRRKDSYGFFLEPVNIEDYPDYWERIGGEDKAMDLGTMEKKLNDGIYTNLDQLEADFHKVINAAKTFNMPGTMPVREANKVFTHGMKHLDRARPLVLTPTPSPSPNQSVSALPESPRSTPHPRASGATATARGPRLEKDVQPKKRIPSQMLEFPPNSLEAKAVAWNQTGGKRVRAKRFVRGRERFIGRWRDWCPDGSRDIAEMDDPAGMLEELVHRNGDYSRTGIDWQKMRLEEDDWWEWDGLGGPTGQPPLPGADRLKPKAMLRKSYEHLDFGPYPQLKKELDKIRNRVKLKKNEPPMGEHEALEAHLRPDQPPPAAISSGHPEQKFENIYKRRPPMEFLYNVVMGGVPGEAYAKSVQRFLDGALDGAAKRHIGETSEGPTIVRDYVAKRWHGGVVQGDLGRIANNAAVAVGRVLPKTTLTAPSPNAPTTVAGIDLSPPAALAAVHQAYGHIALCELTAPVNPLDLAPLLRDPSEFQYQGIGGKSGVLPALDWISNEIQKVAKEQEAVRLATARAKTAKAEHEARGREAREKEAQEKERLAKESAAMVMDVVQVDKTDDTMEVDQPANPMNNIPRVAGAKRSSEELDTDGPDPKRSRVNSPIKVDEPSAQDKAEPNGMMATPAASDATRVLAPQPTPVPMSEPNGSTTPVLATISTNATSAPALTSTGGAAPTPSNVTPAAAAPAAPAVKMEAAKSEPQPDTEAALRQLRLELVAVSKFYPLASLKKMTKDQAKQLLPATVRALMTKADP